MRVLVGLLLGLAAGYAYGFYDGRHNTVPAVMRLTKGLRVTGVPAVQRAESLKADAEAKMQQHANETMKAAH